MQAKEGKKKKEKRGENNFESKKNILSFTGKRGYINCINIKEH